jgi:hypothetical protein
MGDPLGRSRGLAGAGMLGIFSAIGAVNQGHELDFERR